MQFEKEKHIGERALSEAELKRLKTKAHGCRLLSILLMLLLPFAFVGCVAIFSGFPERMPFILLAIGMTFGVVVSFVIGAWVSWEQSRDYYRDSGCGIVQLFAFEAITIERLSLSNRIWAIRGATECLQPALFDLRPSLYVWPDMLPGTTRKMTEAERQEIWWICCQDGLQFLLSLGIGYGGLEFIAFIGSYSQRGVFWSLGVFLMSLVLFTFTSPCFIFTLFKLMDIYENRLLIRDLRSDEVRQYYNMVSGKVVEILPFSRRPWTLDDEPFFWRRAKQFPIVRTER